MGIIWWVIVGLIAGWLAKRIMPGPEPGGFVATLLIGVVGAVVGGWIFTALGGRGVAGGGLIYSIIVATIGAIVFLWVWKALAGRRTA